MQCEHCFEHVTIIMSVLTNASAVTLLLAGVYLAMPDAVLEWTQHAAAQRICYQAWRMLHVTLFRQ